MIIRRNVVTNQTEKTAEQENYFENGFHVVRHGEFINGQNENLEHSMYVRGKRQGVCLIKLNVRFYDGGVEVKNKLQISRK